MKSITVEAKIQNINEVTEFVNMILEKNRCPLKAQMQIDIVVDEIFGNIASYAYGADCGNVTIQVKVEENPPQIILVFIDQGVPYNPLKNKDPDITLSAEERKIGGLGIYMVKKSMDKILYEYANGQNILTLKKELM